MASDAEDDDLASLRQAALKTLKPKAQPIQQVVTVSGVNRSQHQAPWEEYPASADIVSEFHFQPEPLPEPEPSPPPNLTVPPPSLRPFIPMQGIQRVSSQLPMWRQPYNNGLQSPRNFRAQGFTVPNRRAFNHIRGSHRTFGDRGRPVQDRGRFPRRGYMPERGGRGHFNRPIVPVSGVPGLQSPLDAGGNLIVIRPKSANQPTSAADGTTIGPLPGKGQQIPQSGKQVTQEETKPKLSLPQDKYHISQSDATSGNQHAEDSSSASSKPRDKFSRYNDSDSDEEEEEDHSDTEDITSQIDNFLNDCDNQDSSILKEAEAGDMITQESTFTMEVHRQSIDLGEEDILNKDPDCNLESKEFASPEASDSESLDLDALASGDIPVVFEDGAQMDGMEEGIVSNEVVNTKEQKVTEANRDSNSKKAESTSEEVKSTDLADKLSSPKSSSLSSSSSSPSSSSSDSSSSSSEDENDEQDNEAKVKETSGPSDLDDIVNSDPSNDKETEEALSLKNQELKSSNEASPALLSHSPVKQISSSPVSTEHLSSSHPISNRSHFAHHRSRSRSPHTSHKTDQNSKNSNSPKRQLSKEKSSSPRHPSLSPKQRGNSSRRPLSPRGYRNSPNVALQRKSFSPRERSRRSSLSPRGRSISPRQRLSPHRRSRSPRRPLPSKHIYPPHRSRSPGEGSRPFYPARENLSPALRESYRSRRAERDVGRRYPSDSARHGGREMSYRNNSGSRNNRSRSHSRERYKKPLEVRVAKESPRKNKEVKLDQRKTKVLDSPLPRIDLDKLAPEERAKIEARQKKFSSKEIAIDPAKKVSLRSIKERPKKRKKVKDSRPISSNDTTEAETKTSVQKKPKKALINTTSKQRDDSKDGNPIDMAVDSSDSDSGRAWRQCGSKGQNNVTRSKNSKGALLNADRVRLPQDRLGESEIAKRPHSKNLAGRSVKDRLGFARSDAQNQMRREGFVSEDEDSDDESYPAADRLTSSIVKAKPFAAYIPEEKLKIEINNSPKKSKTRAKSKAKPDFSKVYSVPAKRSAVIEGEMEDEEEEEMEVVLEKKVKKTKKKKKKHSREIQEVDEPEAGESDDELDKQPVQSARPSIMDRLGKKVPLPEVMKKEKKKKRKHCDDEPTTELDAKIQKIKEKNAAIVRRQREVEQDKQRYG